MMDDGLKRARYSEVERRIWNDSRFRSLSPIPPCGQGLWLYLLTTPELGSIPGLIVMGESAMAEHLGWTLEAFREAFGEVFAKGMAEADWKVRLVAIPKAIRKHKPQSPNVVISWRQQWLEVPDCALKVKFYRELKAFVEGLGEAFREAFAKACPDPSPNQDQDQDQDQDQEKKRGRPSAAIANGKHGGAAPAAALHGSDPEADQIEAEIRRHAVFALLDARAIAAAHAGRLLSRPQPMAHVLAAIDECAAKHIGLGLQSPALQSRLIGFMRNARSPRVEARPVASVIESDEDTPESMERAREAAERKRLKAEAEAKRRAELAAKEKKA